MRLPQAPFCSVLALLAFGPAAFAQIDDFDDGDDEGWTRLSPLSDPMIPAPLRAPAEFTFPDGNSYRIAASDQPEAAEPFGPPRAGAYRADATYTDFYASVDIIAFDPALDQHFGLLARMSQPGLGTLDGYGVVYNPAEAKLYLSVIADEDGTNLDEVDAIVDDPAAPVRVVFRGEGDLLIGELFSMDDPLTPLATVQTNDSQFGEGFCGIFNVSDGRTIPTDSTFDNYLAAVSEPIALGIVDVRIAGDQLEIEFLSKPGRTYAIDESENLATWNELDDGVEAAPSDRTVFAVDVVPGATRLYRVRLLE